jgi:predicted membrane-bound mannosyltransferase
MILLAGVGAAAIVRWVPGLPARAAACAVLAALAAHLAWESYQLNFRFYADPRNPYVYGHTSPDLVNLADRIEGLARVSPHGRDMLINVVTPENYWPLPWYLRRFNRDHVGYWHDPAAWAGDTAGLPDADVIVLTQDVQAAVDLQLRAAYNRQMMFGLRPNVFLAVYVRQGLWQAYLGRVAGKGQGAAP